MERVNIRQQNLEELYQTPENTLESNNPLPALTCVCANLIVVEVIIPPPYY